MENKDVKKNRVRVNITDDNLQWMHNKNVPASDIVNKLIVKAREAEGENYDKHKTKQFNQL